MFVSGGAGEYLYMRMVTFIGWIEESPVCHSHGWWRGQVSQWVECVLRTSTILSDSGSPNSRARERWLVLGLG